MKCDLDEIIQVYGKEFALGYCYRILTTLTNPKEEKIESVKSIITNLPKPAPQLKSKLEQSTSLPPPINKPDPNLSKIRTYETKHDEIVALRRQIIQQLTINKTGLPLGDIVSLLQIKEENRTAYMRIQSHVSQMVREGILCDTERTKIYNNRMVKKYTLPANQINGNVILTDNRKSD